MKAKQTRPMKPIPVLAAAHIAQQYGYDQVIVIARRCDDGACGGEHVTTYGTNKEHCGIAARCGDYIKHRIMDWPQLETAKTSALKIALLRAVNSPGHWDNCSAKHGLDSECHCGWVSVQALAKKLERG